MSVEPRWKTYLGTKKEKGAIKTYVVDLRYPDGTRSRPELKTTDPGVAEKEFKRWLQQEFPIIKAEWEEAHQGQKNGDPNPKISELVEYYLKSHLIAGAASQTTLSGNAQILRDFELFCRANNIGRIQQLSLKKINEHAAELFQRKTRGRVGLSPKTVENHLCVIRACLNAAVDAEMIRTSPIRKWIMPTVDDAEIQPLTATELRTVLALVRKFEPDVYNIVSYMAYSGQRSSDARGLRKAHVDLKLCVRYKRVKKTGKMRPRDLAPRAIAAIKAELKRHVARTSDIIFVNDVGQPFPKNHVARAFKRALTKGKFYRHVRLHDLRHTFAYLLVNYTNCSLVTAMEQLDHTSIKTTMRYCQPGPAKPHLLQLEKLVDESTEETLESGHWRVTA